MKGLKNKKGFTLIELLAVIVVLAIVTVIASSSILPYMANAGRDAFVTEANTAIDGASSAMSLISLGSAGNNYTSKDNADGTKTYCFTLDNLKALSLWDKEDDDYAGAVVVSVPASGYAYTYSIEIHSGDYYIDSDDAKIEDTEVKDYDKTNAPSGIAFNCDAYK